MHKYVYLFFFFLFSFFYGQEQCPNKEINSKIYLSNYEWRVNRNYNYALQNYLEILELGYNLPYTHLKIAKLAYTLDKDSLGYYHLKKYLLKGGSSLNSLFANKELFSLMPSRDSLFLIRDYQNLNNQFKQNFNLELYKSLLYYHYPDQYFASQDILTDKREQHKVRQRIFQNNLSSLRELFEKDNKLPQNTDLGVYLKPIYLMLLHHRRKDSIDTVNYNFFKKILRDEVCYRKTYLPSVYAKFVDNMDEIFSEGKGQVYGEYVNFKDNRIFPLKEPKLVNCYRAEIGLISIEKYSKLRKAKLPINYIKNDSCTIRK